MRTNVTDPRPGGSLVLSAGDASVTIDPARGGRLASLVVAGRELLVPPPDAADRSIRWGCFLMAPWAGRLAEGQLAWGEELVQLEPNHGRHAIHGLVFGRPWQVDGATDDRAELSIELGDGWPFGGRVRQRIAIEPAGLDLEADIAADRAMPAVLGWHPWFSRRGGDPRVRVDAERVVVTHDLIPTGELAAVAGETDLRAGPRLGTRSLDHAYVDATGPVTIAWPDLELDVGFAPPVSVVVVYTPPDRFCIEPQTAPPNALGLPPPLPGWPGPPALDAGATLRARIRLAWRLPDRTVSAR